MKEPIIKHVLLTIALEKDIPDLTDLIAGRAYTLDGRSPMHDVTATLLVGDVAVFNKDSKPLVGTLGVNHVEPLEGMVADIQVRQAGEPVVTAEQSWETRGIEIAESAVTHFNTSDALDDAARALCADMVFDLPVPSQSVLDSLPAIGLDLIALKQSVLYQPNLDMRDYETWLGVGRELFREHAGSRFAFERWKALTEQAGPEKPTDEHALFLTWKSFARPPVILSSAQEKLFTGQQLPSESRADWKDIDLNVERAGA